MHRKKKQEYDDPQHWGGYMNAKKKKLESQYLDDVPIEKKLVESTNRKSNLFAGVSIFVNGYTEPSATELKRLMMVHGGVYYHYYAKSKCTYIIATNLAQSKIKALRDEKVVDPKWVVDCINQGHLLPVDPYLLYKNPQVQKNVLQFEKQPNSSYAVQQKSSPSEKSNQAQGTSSSENIFETSKSAALDLSIKKYTATATDENFLSEFYNNSRLHHISNSGAEFKRYVTSLQNQSETSFAGLEWLKASVGEVDETSSPNKDKQVIMHLDIDCFFVSVGLRNHPHLIGQPVAVAHSSGSAPMPRQGVDLEYEKQHYSKANEKSRNDDGKIANLGLEFSSMSEIACCNYEARDYGLKNGMFLGAALKLCPALKIIPYEFESYKQVSYSLYDLVASYTHEIEAVSCDEMFFDCTSILRQTGLSPIEFADHIRHEVKVKTHCNSSAGLGSNLLLARLATRKAKPNGSYYVSPCSQTEFVSDVNVRHLPGVGSSLESRLTALNVLTCGDLQTIPLHVLRKEFGQKTGDNLFKFARGICSRRIQSTHERKSVSAEVNYGIRFQKEAEALKFIHELSMEVSKRLKSVDAKGKAISLKLKVRQAGAPIETAKFLGHGICDNITRSMSLMEYTDCPDIISKKCTFLLKTLNLAPHDLRGVGIQVHKLNVNETADSTAQGQKTLQNMFKKMLKKSEQAKNVGVSLPEGVASTSTSFHDELDATAISNDANEHKMVENSPEIKHQAAAAVINDFYPSQLCQVDQSVLDQLPQDIREQVIAFYGNSPSVMQDAPQVANQDRFDTTESITELPNISSIDQTVFSVLPSEIQAELRTAYLQQQVQKTLKPSSDVNAPSRSSTSTTTTYKSPSKHRQRRKGTQISPKKFITGNAKITDHLILTERSPIKVPSKNENSQGPMDNLVKPAQLMKQVEFCGSTNFDEIKKLIRQWVATSKDPVDDDVNILSNYLVSVVRNKDLERTDLLIKHLHRQLLRKNSQWRQAYLNIINVVQEEVVNGYGSRLKVNTHFTSSSSSSSIHC